MQRQAVGPATRFRRAYHPKMNDTDPEMLRKHAEVLRAAGPLRRARMAFSLTDHVMQSCMRAIRDQHPDMTETQRKVKFVEVTYGPELAEKLRRYLRSVGSSERELADRRTRPCG